MRRRAETMAPATRLEALIREGRQERDLFARRAAGEIDSEECWARVFELRRSLGFLPTLDDLVEVVEAEEAYDPMPDPRRVSDAAT